MIRQASIETEVSSKVEEKEAAPTGPQNVHRREGGKINKEKTMKVNLMHKHFIHARSYITQHSRIASDICAFSEIGIQTEEGFCTDKSFKKTFKKKEDNSNGLKFSKNLKSQPSWQSRLSPIRSASEAKQD